MSGPKSSTELDEFVDIRAFENRGDLQLINGYGENSFRILGEQHIGPLILNPRRTLAWQPPENVHDLTIEYILPYIGEPLPPLFILGVGSAPMAPMPYLADSFKDVRIALELMSTGAACRTWNVLMSEGRNAAAGLYAVA